MDGITAPTKHLKRRNEGSNTRRALAMDVFIMLAEGISADVIEILRSHLGHNDSSLEKEIEEKIFYHLTSDTKDCTISAGS